MIGLSLHEILRKSKELQEETESLYTPEEARSPYAQPLLVDFERVSASAYVQLLELNYLRRVGLVQAAIALFISCMLVSREVFNV